MLVDVVIVITVVGIMVAIHLLVDSMLGNERAAHFPVRIQFRWIFGFIPCAVTNSAEANALVHVLSTIV